MRSWRTFNNFRKKFYVGKLNKNKYTLEMVYWYFKRIKKTLFFMKNNCSWLLIGRISKNSSSESVWQSYWGSQDFLLSEWIEKIKKKKVLCSVQTNVYIEKKFMKL